MSADAKLMLIFGLLHLAALGFGVVLFVMFLRSEPDHRPFPPEDDDTGGGGGNDRITDRPKTSPSGGIPLPDAVPAPVRLRGRERLSDLHPRPARRPAHDPEPARPRVPTP